jgi:23S rRNA-/tRNA-specific pseudouridylate synthase
MRSVSAVVAARVVVSRSRFVAQQRRTRLFSTQITTTTTSDDPLAQRYFVSEGLPSEFRAGDGRDPNDPHFEEFSPPQQPGTEPLSAPSDVGVDFGSGGTPLGSASASASASVPATPRIRYRGVKPYTIMLRSYAKEAWIGRTLEELMRLNWTVASRNDLQERLDRGRVLINFSRNVHLDTVVQRQDYLIQTVHMHELLARDEPVHVVDKRDDVVVVSKPPGLPVHAVGRYNYNALKKRIRFSVDGMRHARLHTPHRLDRLTSGLVLMPLTPRAGKRFGAALRDRQVDKVYLARVAGKFPGSGAPIECTAAIQQGKARSTYALVGERAIRAGGRWRHQLRDPDSLTPPRVHTYITTPKDSHTTFELLSYDHVSDTSLVKCSPHTGRTHQLRLHLAFLGFPIWNDALYRGTTYAWDNTLVHCSDNDHDALQPDVCQRCREKLYIRPRRENLWLHAWKYGAQSLDWSFEAPIPDWASDSWSQPLDERDQFEHWPPLPRIAEDLAYSLGKREFR